jgi:hypothetical protein
VLVCSKEKDILYFAPTDGTYIVNVMDRITYTCVLSIRCISKSTDSITVQNDVL